MAFTHKLDLGECLNIFLGCYRLFKQQKGSRGFGTCVFRSDSGFAGWSS